MRILYLSIMCCCLVAHTALADVSFQELSGDVTGANAAAQPWFDSINGGRVWGLQGVDYDGDGDTDLVVTHHDLPYPATIMLRNDFVPSGTVSFADVTATVMPQVPLAEKAKLFAANRPIPADIDNDGDLDLVPGSGGRTHVNDNGVYSVFGTTGNNAQVQERYSTALDLNADGFIDFERLLSSGGITTKFTYLNNQDNTFTQSSALHTPPADLPTAVATRIADLTDSGPDWADVDVNQDGLIDVVVWARKSYGGSKFWYVCLRQPDGSLVESNAALGLPIEDGTPIAIADLTGDGKTDFVVTPGNGAGLWVQDGSGQFSNLAHPDIASWFSSTATYTPVAWSIDLDNDGDLDLAASYMRQKKFRVWDNRDGTLVQILDGMAWDAEGFAVMPITNHQLDFNADGKPDIASGWLKPEVPPSGISLLDITVYLNTSDGDPPDPPDPPVLSGVPGDYNNDGVVDAADYTVWKDHDGQTFQLDNEGEGVTPGEVTSEDYDLWKLEFCNCGEAAAVVPEPDAGTIIPPAVALVAARVRVRRDGDVLVDEEDQAVTLSVDDEPIDTSGKEVELTINQPAAVTLPLPEVDTESAIWASVLPRIQRANNAYEQSLVYAVTGDEAARVKAIDFATAMLDKAEADIKELIPDLVVAKTHIADIKSSRVLSLLDGPLDDEAFQNCYVRFNRIPIEIIDYDSDSRTITLSSDVPQAIVDLQAKEQQPLDVITMKTRGWPLPSGDHYLAMGQFVRRLSACYAWANPPPELKLRIEKFCETAIGNIWNKEYDDWSAYEGGWKVKRKTHVVGTDRVHDNNYAFVHLTGTMHWAFASSSPQWIGFLREGFSVPGGPQNLWDAYRHLTDGGSSEGSAYGEAQREVFHLARLWEQGTGEKVDLGVWPQATITYWAWVSTPDFTGFCPIGDQTRTWKLDGYHRDIMRGALEFVPLDSEAAAVARWWLSASGIPPFTQEYTDVPDGEAHPPKSLTYYSRRIGHFFCRDGWDPDATLFFCVAGGPLGKGHAHSEHGNFGIYQRQNPPAPGPYHDWITVTQNRSSAGGLRAWRSSYQNNLRIEGVESQDRDWNTSTLDYTFDDGVLSVEMDLSEAYNRWYDGESLGLLSHRRKITWDQSARTVAIEDEYEKDDPGRVVYSQLQALHPERLTILEPKDHQAWTSWEEIKPNDAIRDRVTQKALGNRLNLLECKRVVFRTEGN